MSTSFETLADIVFAEKDPAVIEAEVITHFEGVTGRRLYDGDPVRLFLLSFVKYLALQRSLIDFAGKQNLLRYAGEGYLQQLAALVGTEILPPSAAYTTLRFTLSAAMPFAITVRKGVRATPGGRIYFATVADADIPAGELSVETRAVCTQAGAIGNGFYPGQVNRLSDPFPYNFTVENVTLTQGGADREGLEAFRERTRIAPESYSSAGPYGAYMFWAKTASQLITDVSVYSPNPGEVEIVPLLDGGRAPGQDLLDAVYDICSDDTRRPLTDKVIVRQPVETPYNIRLRYFILRGDAAVGLTIQNKVNEAVNAYALWQKTALGRDLNPSKLTEYVMAAGVKRVEVSEPVFTPLAYDRVAVEREIVADYGGLEYD